MAEITGVLLAAGFSSRFGDNKLLQQVNQRPMVTHSAGALQPCDRIVAVVRQEEALLSVLGESAIECIVNPEPERGMGFSIACAVNATAQSSGWCLLPADMPYISTTITQQLVDALREGSQIIAPFYRGQRGHPVAFSDRFYHELIALDGDNGARIIVERNPGQITAIDTDDTGVLRDIDTLADIE
jgi:molybdenum cofactor cytidylyltransferase